VWPFVCSTPYLPPSHLLVWALPCVVRFSLLPIARAHTHLSLLAPAIPPTPLAPALSSVPPASAGARGAVARLRIVPGQAKGTHERDRAGGAHAPRPESIRPDLPSYMLQMYVSSVSDVSEVCCRCFIWKLQK
jgi:hypothetical protein